MSGEVHGLAEFYRAPLGQVAARLLRGRLFAFWPELKGLDLLGLGWAEPYMGLWPSEVGRRIAFAPEGLGPLPGAAQVQDRQLPLPDRCLDRIILVHALEASEGAHPLLRECWRVLRDDGRLLVIVPNRLGSWSLFDHTPFGQGRPYSRGQLEGLLRRHLFAVTRRDSALFVPPLPWSFALRGARLWDRIGRNTLPRLGGVTLIEAEKDLFAAMPAGAPAIGRRVVAELPAGYARRASSAGDE
ncbi:class I SAM-dependent methyltransferase [Sediminicoccus rosea]|jgi:SAM-dependent methyltransferase|uniref:Methyltransferase domain-containing protein n=1 Tax=Sediminicoccus rosea TaxID=1225128 RepID=A0ABZ0PKP5_9PROT|nr:methyltransferase domain-containing protein [Sediminicoccus rosea]WPB86309.1 methyltransferase domain-containing protein [Sediminicoccus rosea]